MVLLFQATGEYDDDGESITEGMPKDASSHSRQPCSMLLIAQDKSQSQRRRSSQAQHLNHPALRRPFTAKKSPEKIKQCLLNTVEYYYETRNSLLAR